MTPVPSVLDQVQRSLEALARHLAQPETARALESASAVVQAETFRLAALLEQQTNPLKHDAAWADQVRRIATLLAACRETVARQAVLNQQALQTLLPAQRSATYGATLGARMPSRYASAGSQSGEFRAVSA